MEYLYDRRPAGDNLPWRSARPPADSFQLVRSRITAASVGAILSLGLLLGCATTTPRGDYNLVDAGAVDAGLGYHRPTTATSENSRKALIDAPLPPEAGRAAETRPASGVLSTDAELVAGVLSADAELVVEFVSTDAELVAGVLSADAEQPPSAPSEPAVHDGALLLAESQHETAHDDQAPMLLPPAGPHLSESPRALFGRHAREGAMDDALSGYHARRPATGSFTMPMLTPETEIAESAATGRRGSGSGTESAEEPGGEDEAASEAESRSDGDNRTDLDMESAPPLPTEPEAGAQEDAPSEPSDSPEPSDHGRAEEQQQADAADEAREHPDDPAPTEVAPELVDTPADEDSAAEPESRPIDEEHRVAVGESLHLTLPGDGWIFVGTESGDAVDLIHRRSTGEQTEFEISIEADGDHDLTFQRQDVTTGAADRHTVRVTGSDDPFDRTPVPDRVPSPAARHTDQPSGIVDVDGVIDWDEIDASAAERDPEPAPSHETLVDEYAAYNDAELQSLLESAINEAAVDRIAALLDAFRERSLVPQPDLLADAADGLRNAGDDEAASDAYLWWLTEYDGESQSSSIHFALASLYEESATTADLRRSVEHYTTVFEQYPRSAHASTAESRARYLRRHFVDIR